MTNQESMKQYLQEASRANPDGVIRHLTRGSLVKRSQTLTYEIDDPLIHKRLGDFPPTVLPYGPIYRSMVPSQTAVRDLFRTSKIVPFSRAVNAHVGECLEKAILVHLTQQDAQDAFLITRGGVHPDGTPYTEHHAFNFVFDSNKLFLVDAQNPFNVDSNGKVTRPYVVPVLGFDNDRIVVATELRAGRTYWMPE